MAKKKEVDIEVLVAQIMKECEEDGEPVTREEALEMAKMEQGATEIKTYVQATTEKKKRNVVRKVDEEKKVLIEKMAETLGQFSDVTDISVKNEVEVSFKQGTTEYTLKLTKHRPPKDKGAK